MFRPNRDSNKPFSADELLKLAEQDADSSVQATSRVLSEDMTLIMRAVDTYNVNPHDLISSRVQRAKDLPRKMRGDLAKVQNMVQSIIMRTAQNIEERNYQQWQGKINEKFQTRREQEQTTKLMSVDKQISISYRSLALAVEQFTELNKVLLVKLEEAEKNNDTMMARQLVVANAVLVYELCDFVIHFIDDFQVAGISELKALQGEGQSHIADFRQRQEVLRQQAMAHNISHEHRDATLKQIDHYEKALKKIEGEWVIYLGQVEEMNKSLKGVYAKLPDLKLMRSNAEAQLDFINLLQLHAFIRTNLRALNLAVETITTQLEMPRMTPERVQILLGNFDEI